MITENFDKNSGDNFEEGKPFLTPEEFRSSLKEDLQEALKNPALDNSEDEKFDEATYKVAVARGKCDIFGVTLEKDSEGVLWPEWAMKAGEELSRRALALKNKSETNPKFTNTFEEEIFSCEVVEERIDIWAAYNAINNAYMEWVKEESKKGTREADYLAREYMTGKKIPRKHPMKMMAFDSIMDEILDVLDKLDDSLENNKEIIQTVKKTNLQANMKRMLYGDYKEVPPWFLE